MKFAEMLIYADIDLLNRIAKQYSCTCNFHSKNELVQSILTSFYRRSSSELISEGLTQEVLDFLHLIVFDTRDEYSKEDILGKAGQVLKPGSDMTARMIFIEAVQRGWLFPGIQQRSRSLYIVPSDVRQSLAKRIGEYHHAGIEVMPTPDVIRDEGTLLVDDLMTFLQFLQKEVVQLTSDGSIYKRYQLLLFELFSTRENPIEKGGWRFGFGYRYPQYPDRFSLLYDFAIHNRFITESGETFLSLTEVGSEKLKSYIPLFEGRELYRFWLRLYRKPIPYLPYIVKMLHASIGSEWVSVESAKSMVLPWLQDYYYETTESLYRNRIVKMLHILGVIKLGSGPDGEAFTFTTHGNQWVQGVQEEMKEIDFSEYKKVRTNNSRI